MRERKTKSSMGRGKRRRKGERVVGSKVASHGRAKS